MQILSNLTQYLHSKTPYHQSLHLGALTGSRQCNMARSLLRQGTPLLRMNLRYSKKAEMLNFMFPC